MTKRFIGGRLFDVLLDGTQVPIDTGVPSRKLPILILSGVLDVQNAIEIFLSALALPVVQLPDITLPTSVPVPFDIQGELATEQQAISQSELPDSGAVVAKMPFGSNAADQIFTRFGSPPDDLTAAIQEFWPIDQWINAAEISRLESAWNSNAKNDTVSTIGPCGTRYFISSLGIFATTELSVGYFQINICAHGGSVPFWEDARNNARKGAELYRSAGNRYTPWLISAEKLGLPR